MYTGCSNFNNSMIRILEKVQNKILRPVYILHLVKYSDYQFTKLLHSSVHCTIIRNILLFLVVGKDTYLKKRYLFWPLFFRSRPTAGHPWKANFLFYRLEILHSFISHWSVKMEYLCILKTTLCETIQDGSNNKHSVLI